jgi:hypothetical protein
MLAALTLSRQGMLKSYGSPHLDITRIPWRLKNRSPAADIHARTGFLQPSAFLTPSVMKARRQVREADDRA